MKTIYRMMLYGSALLGMVGSGGAAGIPQDLCKVSYDDPPMLVQVKLEYQNGAKPFAVTSLSLKLKEDGKTRFVNLKPGADGLCWMVIKKGALRQTGTGSVNVNEVLEALTLKSIELRFSNGGTASSEPNQGISKVTMGGWSSYFARVTLVFSDMEAKSYKVTVSYGAGGGDVAEEVMKDAKAGDWRRIARIEAARRGGLE